MFGTLEISEGIQFIYRIECFYGLLVEEKFDVWLAIYIIAEVKERFVELNIVCVKVLIVSELESNLQYVVRELIIQW